MSARVQLVALKQLTYAGQTLKKGRTFNVARADARVLLAVGLAAVPAHLPWDISKVAPVASPVAALVAAPVAPIAAPVAAPVALPWDVPATSTAPAASAVPDIDAETAEIEQLRAEYFRVTGKQADGRLKKGRLTWSIASAVAAKGIEKNNA
jgi:hypothetical protein